MRIDVEREVAALRAMTVGQLCEKYAELFGEMSRTRHKPYLIRRIAWRLQAITVGHVLSDRLASHTWRNHAHAVPTGRK